MSNLAVPAAFLGGMATIAAIHRFVPHDTNDPGAHLIYGGAGLGVGAVLLALGKARGLGAIVGAALVGFGVGNLVIGAQLGVAHLK